MPRPANEGRGSFWSLAPGSEKEIFKRLLRQQSFSNTAAASAPSSSSTKQVYSRISSSLSSPTGPITLATPTLKTKKVATVGTQTYPCSSIHYDASQSPLLSPSSPLIHTPSPSPSPPLVKCSKTANNLS